MGSISAPTGPRTLAHLRREHLLTAAAAISDIEAGGGPADVALQRHYRRRRCGGRDRACIRELAYGVLRSWYALGAALGPHAAPLQRVCAWLIANAIEPPSLKEVDSGALRLALHQSDPGAAQRHNLPADWWNLLVGQHGADGASILARALNRPAPVDLRVNTLRATVAAARERLAEDNIEAEPVEGYPETLRLQSPAAVTLSSAFREGLVEPQDAGSQRLASFTGARPGERVLDLCAGAGGKTLAMGAMMRDEGTLHATDASASRLEKLPARAQRAGLRMIGLLPPDESTWPDDARDYDLVLVDAPCSGSGTLRRHPELALRGADLAVLTALQGALLARAAYRCATQGRIVYATCSVLRVENEAVVEAFLARETGWTLDETLTLQPPHDGTDGYFAVRLSRG